jgi:hypothetical protein
LRAERLRHFVVQKLVEPREWMHADRFRHCSASLKPHPPAPRKPCREHGEPAPRHASGETGPPR